MRGRRERGAPRRPRRRRRSAAVLRRALLWTLPALLAAAGCAGFVLSRRPAGAAIVAAAGAQALRASAALGLVVTDIEVEGRTTTDAATIMAALDARRGTPILAVSPRRAQQQLEKLPWVRSAVIERRLPHTLFVRLVERHPLAVWQHDGRQELIDRHGEVIPVKDLGRFAGLPTVVGADAPQHAAALLALLATEPALARRVTAAIRVDNRRWNLRIDHAIDVLLPARDPAAAWTRLAALERRQNLFERNILAVDVRLPDRLVLRLTEVPGKPQGKQTTPAKKRRASGKST
jgi:cell division protein FtsQ